MQALKIRTIKEEQYGRYPMAVTDIVKKIQALDSQCRCDSYWKPNFIMTFEDPSKKRRLISVIKIIFVCIVTFIGTAFSIMTFNSDVDIPKLLKKFMSSLPEWNIRDLQSLRYRIRSASVLAPCSFQPFWKTKTYSGSDTDGG